MALHLERRGLTALDVVDPNEHIEVLCLQENELQDFYGMPSFSGLKFLHVDANRISSFLGMSHQPQIEILTAEGNPICNHPHFRIMALLACGESLRIINYRVVTEEERSISAAFGGSGGWAARCVCFGWTAIELVEKSDDEYQRLFRNLKERYIARGHQEVTNNGGTPAAPETAPTPHQQRLGGPPGGQQRPQLQAAPSPVQLTKDMFDNVRQPSAVHVAGSTVMTPPPKESFTAVEAARGYLEAYRRSGTIRGANVPNTSVSTNRTRPGPQPRPALQLDQNEVGCLGVMELQNLDVTIEDEGKSTIADAEIRIAGSSATLEVLESSVLMFQTSLLEMGEMYLEKDAGTVVLTEAPNLDAPKGARTSKVTIRAQHSDPKGAAVGLFKMIMLFKCTAAQLDRFYSPSNPSL